MKSVDVWDTTRTAMRDVRAQEITVPFVFYILENTRDKVTETTLNVMLSVVHNVTQDKDGDDQ